LLLTKDSLLGLATSGPWSLRRVDTLGNLSDDTIMRFVSRPGRRRDSRAMIVHIIIDIGTRINCLGSLKSSVVLSSHVGAKVGGVGEIALQQRTNVVESDSFYLFEVLSKIRLVSKEQNILSIARASRHCNSYLVPTLTP
jgi:hypothetical protein